ncbi:MAG: hypothetical protein HKN11_08050 [Rhizobiales bacterium]|nr:hypothetical protein [Hyphomicrobiales bacterium]
MNRPATIAVALSFVIYLLPVFNVHAGLVPWPLMYFGNLGESGWIQLAAVAGALTIQGLAAWIFYLLLRRFRWWKLAGIAVMVPVLFFAVNFTFMYAVPALVLIAPDWTKDVGELERVCSTRDVSIMQANTGVSLSMERAGKVWVRHDNQTGAGLLSLPDCKLEPAGEFARGSFRSANAAGEVLFSTYEQTYHYGRAGTATSKELAPPAGLRSWNALLTVDGGQLAWLDRVVSNTDGKPHLIRLRDVEDNGNERTIKLALPARNSLTLLEADPPFFTLARYRNDIMVVDDTGAVVWGPVSPKGVYSAEYGFRRIGKDGWVSWDGYREDGQYRIVWSLPGAAGEMTMPRGRKIEALSVSPDGRHIAYSTEANSYFQAQGRLVLFKTAGGEIIYRRRLKQFSRIKLAFLGNGHLAMRNAAKGETGIAVYRVPATGQ